MTSRRDLYKDNQIDNLVVLPPDGGWGWVIVVTAFISNLVVDGIVYTWGIFLTPLSEEYKVTVGTVTITGSVMTGITYLVGPLVSAMMNRYDFRFVTCVGALLTAAGYGVCSIYTEWLHFNVTYSILLGFGLGIIYLPTIVIIGLYFAKWRALANGIATCGSGIGTLAIPPVVTTIMNKYGWRFTFRLFVGVALFVGLATSTTFRPLQPKVAVTKKKAARRNSDELVYQCCGCVHSNKNYPTTIDNQADEGNLIEYEARPAASGTSIAGTGRGQRVGYLSRVSHFSNVYYEDEGCCKRCCIGLCTFLCCGRCEMKQRPMYRDDIFYGQSLMLIPGYKEDFAGERKKTKQLTPAEIQKRKELMNKYHMSVTRITIQKEYDEPCCKFSLSFLRTLTTMLDCRLLKSPAFQLFAFSSLFVTFGYTIPFLYIKDRAVQKGIDPDLATWILSSIGASNTVGRIFSGMLPCLCKIDVVVYTYICIIISGIFTACSGFIMEIWFQFLYAVTYGFLTSCLAALRPVIVVEVFGLANLSNAFGLLLLYMAISAIAGPSLAGYIYDHTQEYNIPFYLAGGCLILSAILIVCIRAVRRWEVRTGYVSV